MSVPWQELAAYAAVLFAAAWLVVRWRRRKQKACDGCHATNTPRQKGDRLHLPVVDPKLPTQPSGLK